MSQAYISSPVRSPRPRHVDFGSPSVAGAARQAHALRSRSAALLLASPTRLYFPSGQFTHTAQNGARDAVIPPAFYSSREDTTPEAQARREDEEHGATQLILLLTLSVVLLTLPWVVDHPVTLLVPVALFILPITSGALRSLVSEGFALISSGFRWFWRHRKAGRPNTTLQHAPAATAQRSQPPQASAPPPYVHSVQLMQAWQPTGAFHAPQNPEPWQSTSIPLSYPGAHVIVNQHARVDAAGLQPGNLPNCVRVVGGNGVSQAPAWQATLQRPHHAVQAKARQPLSAGLELTTPDLDFDAEGDVLRREDVGGRISCDKQYFAQGPAQAQAMVPTSRCSLQQVQMGSDAARYSNTSQKQPRPPSRVQSIDQTPECTVYNWDEADECTRRRGHRLLSDLLDNVQ